MLYEWSWLLNKELLGLLFGIFVRCAGATRPLGESVVLQQKMDVIAVISSSGNSGNGVAVSSPQ